MTLGKSGALLHCGGTPVAVPAPAVAAADPCGAGDRFAVACDETGAGRRTRRRRDAVARRRSSWRRAG
ncbi:hypothetical protein [Lentzea guizhouensis]|uniref:hypothetical protein n=1 Tax=Lentzea guizhouensis TaxID=1586287 RepID=UPI001472E0DE